MNGRVGLKGYKIWLRIFARNFSKNNEIWITFYYQKHSIVNWWLGCCCNRGEKQNKIKLVEEKILAEQKEMNKMLALSV